MQLKVTNIVKFGFVSLTYALSSSRNPVLDPRIDTGSTLAGLGALGDTLNGMLDAVAVSSEVKLWDSFASGSWHVRTFDATFNTVADPVSLESLIGNPLYI